MELGKFWPTEDSLLKAASERALTSDELLALKSRSFYGPILLLELLKGENEHDKRPYVRNAYNLLRETDEIEDSSLTTPEKIEIMKRFGYLIGEITRRGGNIDDIVNGDEFKTITQKLSKGAVGKNAELFVQHFGKGAVLRELHSFDRETREAMDYSEQSMIGGMTRFLELGEIKTQEQLHDYCYHVAGRVGGLLTKLASLKDRINLDVSLAEKFGEYLQLINILRGIRRDYSENRAFVPFELIPGDMTRQYMMEQTWDDAKKAREQTFNSMVGIVKNNFKASVDYASSIPEQFSGFKAFCLAPLITAQKTLEHMCNAGPERVFSGDPSAIKIPSEMMFRIIDISEKLVKDPAYASDWIGKFRENPESVSIEKD